MCFSTRALSREIPRYVAIVGIFLSCTRLKRSLDRSRVDDDGVTMVVIILEEWLFAG